MSEPDASIPAILEAAAQGDRAAFDQLIAQTFQELRGLARAHMRGQSPDHTLQATALLSEAVCRLLRAQRSEWNDLGHFYAYMSRVMRTILVDHARRKLRGPDQPEASPDVSSKASSDCLDSIAAPIERERGDLIAINTALEKLEQFDPQGARFVELRFFAGHTVEEAATLLGMPLRTAERGWKAWRAWIAQEVERDS